MSQEVMVTSFSYASQHEVVRAFLNAQAAQTIADHPELYPDQTRIVDYSELFLRYHSELDDQIFLVGFEGTEVAGALIATPLKRRDPLQEEDLQLDIWLLAGSREHVISALVRLARERAIEIGITVMTCSVPFSERSNHGDILYNDLDFVQTRMVMTERM